MLKTFLLAGGAGNEDFRFCLRATKQKLNQALLDIGYKEKSGAQAHMVPAKLTYQDICTQAEDVNPTQYNRKKSPKLFMPLTLVLLVLLTEMLQPLSLFQLLVPMC